MAGNDGDKNKEENSSHNENKVTSGASSLKGYAFGDDDDFVVPDHIQDIINEVHGSETEKSTQNSPQPEAEPPTEKIVSFEDHDAGHAPQASAPIASVPPPASEQKNSDIYGLVGEVSPEQKAQENAGDENAFPNQTAANNTPPAESGLADNRQSLTAQDDTPQSPAEESGQETADPDLSFSGLPPKKSESIFDKPPGVPHRRPEETIGQSLQNLTPKIKLPAKKTIRPLKKITAVLLIGALGVSTVFYGYKYYSDQAEESREILGSTSQATETIPDMVKRVAEIVELSDPEEQPTEVATIDDINKLTNNAFFDRAKNGDLILIYQVSKIAVLYRPALGRVIAIGPIDSGTPDEAAPPLSSEEESVKPAPAAAQPGTNSASAGSPSAAVE